MGELQHAKASSIPPCNQPPLSLGPESPVWDPSTPMVLSHLSQEPRPSGQYKGACLCPGKRGVNHIISGLCEPCACVDRPPYLWAEGGQDGLGSCGQTQESVSSEEALYAREGGGSEAQTTLTVRWECSAAAVALGLVWTGKGNRSPEHLDECLAVGSGLEPRPPRNLPLRGTLSTEPGSLWVWARSLHVCVGALGCPPVAGGGCGCGAVVRRRTGVAPREGCLGFPADDVVCCWHILGDILEQRIGQELVPGD